MSIIESSKGVALGDIALFLGVCLVAGTVLIGSGAANLPGSQGTNLLCSIPLANSLIGGCSPDVNPGDQYKLTTEIEVSRNGISDNEIGDAGFRYKTSENPGFTLSAASPTLSFFLPDAKNGVVDYVIKDDGVVIGSDRKNVGDVGAFETKTVSFDSTVDSGTYTVGYVFDYEYCQYGSCDDRQDTLTKTVEIPKLPLGEY